ncbi:hypothetical protein CF15_05890 [Pyrodictium occultum]|uniref:Replication initiator protein WhiP n=1 Tax=Pyrodictium occultum TaxID=2309 RepID=A0A0V8RW36_PYROC|nr:hypothetical protein [Pyrodictium occultum]KSW12279.1 hypothetical protein CF15_05890 [Pyrodictium occultum]
MDERGREQLEWVKEAAKRLAQRQRGGGGPRSKLVEAIAVLLLARPMRAAEIAQVVGKPTRYVSSYLSYWRTRGLFDYENGFWVLTPQGEDYAKSILEREMNSRIAQYAALARQILSGSNTQVSQAANNNGAGGAGEQSGRVQPFIATHTINLDKKQQERILAACIRALLEELEIGEDERQVLETLLDHYRRWGMTYMYLDQLEKELEADRVWLVGVLRGLQTKGLVYLYSDRRLGMRIGLSKRVKGAIAACTRTALGRV